MNLNRVSLERNDLKWSLGQKEKQLCESGEMVQPKRGKIKRVADFLSGASHDLGSRKQQLNKDLEENGKLRVLWE